MQIKITGAHRAPSWTTLQQVLRETINNTATITRINRRDRGVNYTIPGTYDLTVRTSVEEIPLELIVE